MTTKIFKSMNIIRCVSKANLNLFRYTAMVAMLLTIGIGNVWGSSNYYASLKISEASGKPTGAGSVYVANSNSKPSSANAGTAVQSAATTTSGGNVSMYWWVDITPGYNVSLSGKVTGGPYSAASANGNVACAASTSKNGVQAYTATATFVAVTVDKVNNSTSNVTTNLNPTDPSADYPFTVTFATSNLKTIALDLNKSPETADGKFTIIGWAQDGNNVIATGKFNGGGSYGGAGRNNSTTVSLQSKASGSTAKTCTVTANFPALAFVDADVMDVYTTQNDATKTGSADFNFNYGAEDDFPTEPSFTHTSGSGAFTVTGYEVKPNFSDGTCKVTVNYSFNPNGVAGTTKEELKITSAGGLVATATVTGESEAEATDDAKVIASDGVTEIYVGDWATAWSEANKVANAGCTLQVLRNVTGGSLNANQTVTNTFTLDLNGKVLTAKYNGSIIYINKSGKTLTIKDSKTGGQVKNVNNDYAGTPYCVNLTAGALILESGTLYAENTKSGYGGCGILQKAATTLTINNGRVEALGHTNTFGIDQQSSMANSTTFTMNNGDIYAEGASTVYAIRAYGKVNINDGTIISKATTQSAFGIRMLAYSHATAANCYYGTLTMKGGTINVDNVKDANDTRYAYGIYFDFANTAMGTATATDGSHANKAAAVGSIENATINVTTLGRYAYGILAYGSYQSKTNEYDVIKIKDTKIDATAKYYYAYGVDATGGVNGTHGAIYFANIELTNCEVNAKVDTYTTAYAVYATSSSATVYKNVQPNYYGEYAGGATVTINSGIYTATTGTTNAYAVCSSTRSKTTFHSDSNVAEECKLGEGVEGYATLNIHGGEFTATSGTTTARAVSSGGHTTIDGGTFTANAGTTTAYAVYAISGTLDVAGVEVNAEANSTAVGVYVDCAISTISGFKYYADATLKNLTVTAITRSGAEADGVLIANYKRNLTAATLKSDSTSNKWSTASYNQYANIYQYGEYAVGPKCSIIGGTYTAKSATTTAYGVRLNGPAISADSDNDGTVAYAYGELNITNAKITSSTNGTTTVYGVWTGGPTTITNCDITASSKTTTCSGVLIEAGKTTISGTTITATGTETVRGIYVNSRIAATNSTQNVNTEFSGVAGFECVGELEASDNIVTASATSGNTAYGIYLHSVKGNTASGPFMGDHAIAGKAIINSGTYKATATGTTAYGIYLLAQTKQGDVLGRPKCTVTGGKFYGSANGGTDGAVNGDGQLGYFVLSGGYYNKNANLSKYKEEGKNVNDVLAGTPEYTEGYRYKISSELSGAAVCKVYTKTNSPSLVAEYATLEEALQYVNANTGTNLTIVMIADYTLKKGDYILPSNATLIVPESLTRKSAMGTKPSREVVSPPVPVQFLMLTFDKGANMTVKGTIETSAVNTSANGGAAIAGAPHGNYGRLHLVEGSTMTLESNANLNCWGYITGKGEINALNGATVREGFQLGYWRGGTATSAMLNNKSTWHAFPVTDYFIQSVEAPILFRPGAKLLGYSSVNVSWPVGQQDADNVQLLGTNNSMFLMNPAEASEDTYVRKEYDPETDRAIWTVNSGAKLGSFSFSLAGNTVNSADYYLPVSNNMTIYVNEGEFTVTQDALLIPGAQIIISKLGKLTVASGKRLFVMDNEDWPGFVTHSTGAVSRWYYNALYSPSWTTNPRTLKYPPTTTRLPDAEIFVQGETEGSYYTSTSGANIHSTNDDAGKVKFVAAAGADNSIQHVVNTDNDRVTINFTTAQLKNETPETPYTSSKGTVAGEAFVYMEQQWVKVTDGCLTTRTDGSGTHEYAKPSDVVEVVSNGDNAYRDKATNSRYFINAEEALSNDQCVWWEVEPVTSGTYAGDYMANQEKYDNYGAYYYWDGSAGYWKPRYVTVTWKNQDGSTLATYTNVMCNTSPKYLSASPTWANTSIEKHDWVGWRDADGNIYDKNAVLPVAQGNVTYTAYYNVSKYEYTIKFVNPDKTVIWAGLVEAGTIPECPVEPTQAPTVSTVYTFTGWNTTPVEVTGTATYTAVYSSSTRKYHVTFYNYDAQTVLYEADVDYNTRPEYGGVTPFRANTSSFSYEWKGWQKGSDTYDTDDDLAFVTGNNVNYIAIYSQTDLKYQVFFKRQDGSIIDAPLFNYEETPEVFPANPTLASTVSTDYTFDHWDPATLQPVTVDGMVYTAYFSESPRQYTAHFVNYDGKTLNADQTIDYNTVPAYTGATPFKPNDSRNSFEFSGWAWEAGADWEAGSIGIGEAFPAIKGDITFTAQFNPVLLQFNVIYQREDGTFIKQDKVKWGKETEAPVADDCNYEDERYTYTLFGWSPATIVNPVTTDATYTAQYTTTPRSYSVTLNTNEGTINAGNVTSYTYGTGAMLPTNVTRTGYGFSGWYDNSGLTGSAVENISATATGDKAYWAKWTVHTHKFAWDFAGGSTSSTIHTAANNALAYGSAISYPADNTMTKTGYTFAGWSSSVTTMPDEDLTITANWNAVSYNLTYEGLNGATNSNPAAYTIETVTFTLADPGTREGYNFTGWTCGGSPITQIAQGSTGNKTITANWTAITYNLTYEGLNGATNSNPATYTVETATITLANPGTRTGYNFTGWTCGGSPITQIALGSTGNKTITANWTAITYNLTYEGLNGATNSNPATYTVETATITLAAPGTRTGYNFTGWTCGGSPITQIALGSTGNKTITANWTAITYNLTYEGLNGATNSNPATYTVETATITLAAPGTRTGYNFTGWTCGGSPITQIALGSTGDKTITANFAAKNYTVTLNTNNGTINAGNVTGYTYGVGATLPANVTRTGYDFGGWYENSGLTGSAVTAISTTATGNKTYWAKWTASTYTVTLNTNSGTINAGNVTSYTYGAGATLPTNVTRTGYDFGGWYENSGLTGSAVTAISTTATGNKEYWAKWTGISYTVRFNANEGTGTMNNQSFQYGESKALSLNAFTRTGYSFVGWAESASGEVVYTDGKVVSNLSSTQEATVDLYAKWLPIITWIVDINNTVTSNGIYGETPTYPYGTPEKPMTDQNTFSFEGWYPTPQPVTGPATYTAQFQNHTRYYTITWKNYDGTELETDGEDQGMQYGAAISYNGARPAKADPSGKVTYTFIGWSPAFVEGDLVAHDQIYTAQFRGDIVASENSSEPVTISVPTTDIVTTTVETTGKLDIQSTGSLTTNTLILQATSGDGNTNNATNATSGEITGAEYINTTNTNVYFDLTLNSWARHWHAFGVPWPVDLKNDQLIEIKDIKGNEVNHPLIFGRDVDILYYDGKERATNGPSPACWKYVEDDPSWVLQPGVAYMIGLPIHVGTIRFPKKADQQIAFDGNINLTNYGGDDTNHNHGWNSVANPTTFHALLKVGEDVTECQVYNGDTIGSDGYTPYDMSGKFVVGQAVYVQVRTPETVVIDKATNQDGISPLAAPRRSQGVSASERLEVQIAPVDAPMADRIYLMADEDKEDHYIITRDLSKAGLSTVRAQMWINRYGLKLCKNTTALRNNQATYPLGISVPQAGEYEISSPAGENGDMLYLTYDGRIIWNLTYAPYSASFEKGTNTRYGLKLVRSNAPVVTTDMEQLSGDNASSPIQKVLIDDQVYVLRGEEIYTITGQKAK